MNAKEIYEKSKELDLSEEEVEIISKNSRYSRLYAQDIQERFELGEKAISKSAFQSYLYAKNILGKRFELGEKAIAKHPNYSLLYAKEVLCDEFEMGEDAIATCPNCSLYYAKDIVRSRFEKGEKAISNCAKSSYEYSLLLGERFELGEKSVAKDPTLSFHYAQYCIEGRFLLGEDSIFEDDHLCVMYAIYMARINTELPDKWKNKIISLFMSSSQESKILCHSYFCLIKEKEDAEKLRLVSNFSAKELKRLLESIAIRS